MLMIPFFSRFTIVILGPKGVLLNVFLWLLRDLVILQLNMPTESKPSLKVYISSTVAFWVFFLHCKKKKSVSNPICPLSVFVQLFLISHTEGISIAVTLWSHLFSSASCYLLNGKAALTIYILQMERHINTPRYYW